MLSLDLAVFQFFSRLGVYSPFTETIAIFLAEYLPYLLLGGVLVFIARQSSRKRRWRAFLLIALTLILARGIIAEFIRAVYFKPRPFMRLGIEPLFTEGTSAFPSSHATIFFALGVAIFSLDRMWGGWFLALAALNGLARIASGVHWPSDILAGAILGAVSFGVVSLLLRCHAK